MICNRIISVNIFLLKSAKSEKSGQEMLLRTTRVIEPTVELKGKKVLCGKLYK